VLEIRDNGQGFDPEVDYPGHLGLRSMGERMNNQGGTLEIISTPGGGTRVRACISFQEPDS
jgi:signal transduction histidine kinase